MPSIRTTLRVENLSGNSAIHGGVPNRSDTVETESSLTSQSVQVIGTTHVAAAGGAVGDGAYVVIQNRSTTATVEIGGDAATVFVPWFTIPPGAPPAIIPRVDMSDLFIKASAASTEVLVTAYKIFITPPPPP
jgi:hypothetical protein